MFVTLNCMSAPLVYAGKKNKLRSDDGDSKCKKDK